MIIVTSGRRGGKTVTMIKWWMEDPENRFILVTSEEEKLRLARLMQDVYPNYRRGIRQDYLDQIITTRSYFTLRGRSNVTIGIDNLDLVLQNLFGFPVDFASATATTIPISLEVK